MEPKKCCCLYGPSIFLSWAEHWRCFACFDHDPRFVHTIPERYNWYAATSDGSTNEANAPTMDVVRDEFAHSCSCLELEVYFEPLV